MVQSFLCSVNDSIIDKPAKGDAVNYARNWAPRELTVDDAIDVILSGRAISAQFNGGYRKTENFVRAGFIAADFDEGDVTIAQAGADPFIKANAAFIYTTPSHTQVRPRFRPVFVLAEPIGDAQKWADAQLGLACRLNSDRSIKDGARLFFGNRAAEIHRVGATLGQATLDELIAFGSDHRRSVAHNGKALPVISSRPLTVNQIVKTATGQMVPLSDLPERSSVHCPHPHHNDQDPSAFVVRSNRSDALGVHCMACGATFWSNDDDGYDFGAFDRLFEERRRDQSLAPDAKGFDQFFPLKPRFLKYREPFLPKISYELGTTLVKSPKGTGKTEALVSLLQDIRKGRYRSDIKYWQKPRSVLLISHRQALVREMAPRLGLHSYLDPLEKESGLLTLAVCLDSLPKFNEPYVAAYDGRRPVWKRDKPFDLVIIDEVEQVLRHLLSDTLATRIGMERCYDALFYEVSGAKALIALDADLGLVTTHVLRTLRPQDWAHNCRIIYNEPTQLVERRTLQLYSNRAALEQELLDAVKTGERCFVTSNSKKFINTTLRMIQNECGDHVTCRAITSDNSRSTAEIRFIENIKTEMLKTQVLLTSPTLGTGIDISFPNGECKVDRVFGFFYPFINTHTDIDQQLARVRNPGRVQVWIDPARFNFTSNVDVIKDDLARAYFVPRAVEGREADGRVKYDPENPLLLICAHVVAEQRASKNRLVELFKSHREAYGWVVEVVDNKGGSNPAYKAARAMLEAERVELLGSAPRLSSADYVEFDQRAENGDLMTPQEKAALEKARFEDMVGVEFTRELIRLDIDGRLLKRVKQMSGLLLAFDPPGCSWKSDGANGYLSPEVQALRVAAEPNGRLVKMAPARLIATLLISSGLATTTGITKAHQVSTSDLAAFADLCWTNRTIIEEVLREQVRRDVARNPVRQLNVFLRQVGLSLKPASRQKAAGVTTRYYVLDAASLDQMVALAKSYRAAEARRRDEASALRPLTRAA